MNQSLFLKKSQLASLSLKAPDAYNAPKKSTAILGKGFQQFNQTVDCLVNVAMIAIILFLASHFLKKPGRISAGGILMLSTVNLKSLKLELTATDFSRAMFAKKVITSNFR